MKSLITFKRKACYIEPNYDNSPKCNFYIGSQIRNGAYKFPKYFCLRDEISGNKPRSEAYF